MASKDSAQDAAAKARIIEHMNRDHQDSLVRFLESHHSLGSFSAKDAKLTDITPTQLHITAGGSSYKVPISPALSSYAAARDKLVTMDATAISQLGRSPLTLKKYIPPTDPIHIGSIFIVIGLLVLCGSPSTTLPASQNTTIFAPLVKRFPDIFALIHQYRVWLLFPLMGVHAVENIILGFFVLRKYSVPIGSGLWFAWLVSNFFEGFGSFVRIGKWRDVELAKKGSLGNTALVGQAGPYSGAGTGPSSKQH